MIGNDRTWQVGMNPSQWWRDSRIRRRVVLGFYVALLLAVGGVVLGVVVTVMIARTGSLSDRLAETGDWLAGGTLALAAIAGLVALQAYASATGLPELRAMLYIEGPRIPDQWRVTERQLAYPLKLTGPFAFLILIKNDSGYSARNPAIVMRFFPNSLATDARQIGEGWTITDGDTREVRSIQWDGGAAYSIHGNSIRRLRLDVGFVVLQSPERLVKVELLAEGYRREVHLKLGEP